VLLEAYSISFLNVYVFIHFSRVTLLLLMQALNSKVSKKHSTGCELSPPRFATHCV